MLKLVFLILIILNSLFFSSTIFGQSEMRVVYERSLGKNFDEKQVLRTLPKKLLGMADEILAAYATKQNSILRSNSSASLYFQQPLPSTTSQQAVSLGVDSVSAVYFDFKQRAITQNKSAKPMNLRLSSEDFHLSFKHTGITRTILGYSCLEATIFFCGNNFFVYYTPELPIPSGPEKFVGLPGLVLAVSNQAQTWSLTAIQIDVVNDECEDKVEKISKKRLFELLPKASEISYAAYCERKNKQ